MHSDKIEIHHHVYQPDDCGVSSISSVTFYYLLIGQNLLKYTRSNLKKEKQTVLLPQNNGPLGGWELTATNLYYDASGK